MENFKLAIAPGQIKEFKITPFSAMDGWVMQNRFIEFASTTDSMIRRQYTLDVLAYAKAVVDGLEIPLSTDALIDNHLCDWRNVQALFEEILRRNGIDPETHADKPDYWADAGARMAVSFIAEAAKLFGPAFAAIEKTPA